MAQHTPGPWLYGTRASGFDAAEICTVYNVPTLATEDGKGQTWANVSASKPCYEVDADEREANARLIAAAPEMLEVLAEYLTLGAGKCTIGRRQADKALAVVRKATEGRS